jgi:hypothetical protein
VSSRFNSQANQEWWRVSPNRGRRNAGGQPSRTSRGSNLCTYKVGTTSVSFSTNYTAHDRPISSSHAFFNHPTTPYALSANKRKHENRRSNRHALYQELQELVLSKVHVWVRLEGQVHPFYDKITLRLDSTLNENKRYRYLVERLVRRPRNPQGRYTNNYIKG